jgi:hypothetical protein
MHVCCGCGLVAQGDILYKQRLAWKDPKNVLRSWDPKLANPCTWFHVTCNNDNSVIRVYVPPLTYTPLLITYYRLCKSYSSRNKVLSFSFLSAVIVSIVSYCVVLHVLVESGQLLFLHSIQELSEPMIHQQCVDGVCLSANHV